LFGPAAWQPRGEWWRRPPELAHGFDRSWYDQPQMGTRKPIRVAGRHGLAVLGATLAALGAPPALASAATRYVQVGGNDSSSCESALLPCATVEHAVAEAAAGDTIQIGPGEYREGIRTPPGKPLHFIGSGASGPEATLIEDSNPEHPALWMESGGSVEALRVRQPFPNIGGALQVATASTETVAATNIIAEGQSREYNGSSGGSDAIAVNGGAFHLSDSTVNAINSVAAVEQAICSRPTEGTPVINDGSGIEIAHEQSSVRILNTRITAERGMALRVHGHAGAVEVIDSALSSNGAENLTEHNECEGWPVIEAGGSKPLILTGDTVYNGTLGGSEHGQPPADALSVEPETGNAVTLTNTILHAQPSGVGSDINTFDNVTASHSSFTTVQLHTGKAGEPTVTSPETAGNVTGEPELAEPATGDLALQPSSPLVGAGDPAVLEARETDVTGAPRATTCAGGLSLVNIGAYESAAPQCPASEPALEGGPSSYLYVAQGTASGGGLEQFLLGEGEGLAKLSPFEVATPGAQSRTIVAGSQSPQLYVLEGGALQQYRIKHGGQLIAGARIEQPSGEAIAGAALGANGHDLYVLLASTGKTHSIAVEHEYASPNGALSSAAAPLTLPGEGIGGKIAVDRAGRVYVAQAHEASEASKRTSTLFSLRVNPDGTLSLEDSLAMPHAPTGFAVAPNGREAALLYTKNLGASDDGVIYPVAIAADGALSAAANIPSATSQAGHSNYNNPSSLMFAPDSESLYVTNKDEAPVFEGVAERGSLVSPFKVKVNGELQAENSEPLANFSTSYSFDAGIALSPTGRSAYLPNDNGSPASGTVDEFTVGAEGKLTPGTPAAFETQPDQSSVALVTPPPTAEEPPPGEEHPTVVLTPPPPPARHVTQGVAGTVSDAATHAPVEGAAISACPASHLLTVSCVGATTDASGMYSLTLAVGRWLIQVYPPSSALFAASAEVNVTAGAQTVQNFALSAPRPLSHGVTFDTPGGPVSGGVPTVNWTTPFTVEGVHAGAPKHSQPGRTLLITHLVGLSSNTTSSAAGGFERAGVIIYAVHYGAGGKPVGMSEPMIAQVKCDKKCTHAGAPPTHHSHRHHGGSGTTATHEGKATILVFPTLEGWVVKVKILHHYKVGLIAGGDPLEEATIDLSAIERGEESDALPAIEGMVSGLAADPHENAGAAQNIADGHDNVSVDFASIDAESHGGMTWYDVPNDGVASEQPAAARADGIDSFPPEDTRLTQKEAATDEQEALDAVNEYRAGHGEGPLDPAQAASLLGALDAYTKEVGELGLTSTREDDTEEGLLNYLESAQATVEELGLPQHDAEQLYNALRNGAPALFPNGNAELADDERAKADEERADAEQVAREEKEVQEEAAWVQWKHEREAKEKAGEPPYEPEEEWESEESSVYMDPSGLVQSTRHVPLYGATVTLSRSSTPHGKLARVPNGSIIMSPSNRRNPSRTTVAGLFGWDTFSGYYRISATHVGCRRATTSVFAVPPPRSNLQLALRCGRIRRARTRLVLHAHRTHGTLVLHVTVRPTHGRARAGRLIGAVLIRSGAHLIAETGLNAHGKSLIDLPSMASRRRSLTVTYVGNGLYAPARKRL
jgi:hypothetical protein